jgi:hypothetical protein
MLLLWQRGCRRQASTKPLINLIALFIMYVLCRGSCKLLHKGGIHQTPDQPNCPLHYACVVPRLLQAAA